MLVDTKGAGPCRFASLLILTALAVILPAVCRARPAGDKVAEFRIPPDAVATVEGSGLLTITDVGDGSVLLDVEQAAISSPNRLTASTAIFSGLFSEGAPCGHRGFSGSVDDDGDGLIDEDRADGLDNDGDGLIDEDFAAIGDGMAVVSRRIDGRAYHLEVYHWDYPHLDNIVFLGLDATARNGNPEPAQATLTSYGGEWVEIVADLRRHSVADETVREDILNVSRIDNGDRSHWLGVLLVGDGKILGSGDSLDAELADGSSVLAIAAAPTLLQLRFAMSFVHALKSGAPVVPGGDDVPWIVPPLCPACRQARALPARWESGAEGSWRLIFTIDPGSFALLDPDEFNIGGRALGAPLSLAWNPGEAESRGWEEDCANYRESAKTAPALLSDPYLDHRFGMRHDERGELVFTFADGEPHEGEFLAGGFLCGRSFIGELAEPQPEPVVDEYRIEAASLDVSGRPPMLSPTLLETFPNPFRDQTRLRFRVPETVGEGFVWGEGESPAVDLEARIPYSSSSPVVSLKVYTVAGHEIATIFNGSRPVGEFEFSWDGNDAAGRKVAAGTYFCKLQIEHWSVTKRVTFLR